MLEIAAKNILSPPVLAFAGGAVVAASSGLVRLPRAIYSALSAFLLAAIGFKGGVALSQTSASAIAAPAAATIALGLLVPIVIFAAVRILSSFSVEDSAALAAHYGSVSVVTFTAAIAFVTAVGVPFEGFMPALVALLEIPGIAVALIIARVRTDAEGSWRDALREVFTGRSVILLGGGLAAGSAAGVAGMSAVPEVFHHLFIAALVVFLLDMGMAAAGRVRDIRESGRFLISFGIVTPLILGVAGALLGSLVGLSPGGSTVFATMAASASYIAAPAAVQIALPQANPGLYLTASLGITFPFNLILGIPLYHTVAQVVG